jgi:hypothetical protein
VVPNGAALGVDAGGAFCACAEAGCPEEAPDVELACSEAVRRLQAVDDARAVRADSVHAESVSLNRHVARGTTWNEGFEGHRDTFATVDKRERLSRVLRGVFSWSAGTASCNPAR